MADQPTYSKDGVRSQPLLNGELAEFREEWPRSSDKHLGSLSRLLTQYGLQNCDQSSDSASETSVKKRKSRQRRTRKKGKVLRVRHK